MSTRSTISFVVPAYNVASYLDECLDSVVKSSQPGDQIVLVDDGSTDETADRCRQWAVDHPTLITLIEQGNQGLSAARNTGLRFATRPYVLFMDSDDVVKPEAVAKARPVLDKHEPDILVMDFCWWYPERTQPFNRSPMCSHSLRSPDLDRNAFCLQTFKDNRLSACSRIFRRDLLAQLAPDVFPPGDAYEEIATVPRLTLRARSLYYLDEVLFDYRVRPGSITQSKTAKHCLDLSKALGKAVHEVRPLGLDQRVELAANMAAAKLCIAAIRDCGLVPDRPPALYERTLAQGLATLTLSIESVAHALRGSPHPADRKAAGHLLMSKRFPCLFIALRKMVYGLKRNKRREKLIR